MALQRTDLAGRQALLPPLPLSSSWWEERLRNDFKYGSPILNEEDIEKKKVRGICVLMTSWNHSIYLGRLTSRFLPCERNIFKLSFWEVSCCPVLNDFSDISFQLKYFFVPFITFLNTFICLFLYGFVIVACLSSQLQCQLCDYKDCVFFTYHLLGCA